MIKTKDPFSGDPKLFLTPDGMTLRFTGGVPFMDQGFENFTTISLFTAPNYWGNTLKKGGLKYGSSFFDRTSVKKEPITLANLAAWGKAAEKDLKYNPFGKVTVTITNPQSNKIKLVARLEPPTGDTIELSFLRNGQNWINQALYGSTEFEDFTGPTEQIENTVYTSSTGVVYWTNENNIYIPSEG